MTTVDSRDLQEPYFFHPDELVLVVSTDRSLADDDHRALYVQVQQVLQTALREASLLEDAESVDAAFRDGTPENHATFDAPDLPSSLHFLVYRLNQNAKGYPPNGNTKPWQTVKRAVDLINGRLDTFGEAISGSGETQVRLEVAMPSWFSGAQVGFGDGSPASKPRPVRKGRVPAGKGRWQYRATLAGLDLRDEVRQLEEGAQIPVVVLDTAPEWAAVRVARDGHPENKQLGELVDWIEKCAESPAAIPRVPAGATTPVGALSPAEAERLQRLDDHVRLTWSAWSEPIEDHGLFVAGLIHDAAPLSPLRLVPVLSRYGVGDLPLLLAVMSKILADKQPDAPVIVNLSLGFLPPHEILPAIWHSDPGTPYERGRDDAISAKFVELLDAAAEKLLNVLRRNNVLVIAAAGNDSTEAVEHHEHRWSPRVPARYESVLSVSAITGVRDPGGAAAPPALYANVGDLVADTNGVATVGGDADRNFNEIDGIIGVYTAEKSPDSHTNETGWAKWSGTSFATPIIAGIAANYWAVRRKATPGMHADTVHSDITTIARTSGIPAADLAVPAIDVQGEWIP